MSYQYQGSNPKGKRDRDTIRKANEMHPGKYLSEHQVERFIATSKKLESIEPRNALMMQLLFCTGGRPSEILGLTPENTMAPGLVYLRGLKGSDSRWAPLPKEVYNRLVEYMEGFGSHDLLFPLTYSRFDQISKHYLPKGKSLRSLRHTYAMRLYDKTKDIRLVQKTLGHRFVSTTEIYTRTHYGNEELIERATVSWE